MADTSAEITHKQQLIDYIAEGEKPVDQWRIGTEHEKFVFARCDHTRAPYFGEASIQAILQKMKGINDEPIMEGENIVGLKLSNGGSVTLEPGGQFELSGAPLENVHQTCDEIQQHLEILRPICQHMGLSMVGIGFDPISRREDIQWMPKGRYKIMREYMPKRGNMGIDMMIRTCTVQVNLDYANEIDMREKMRISATFQPVATALFANSPFKELQPSGYQSTRALCWRNADPDRTGMPKFLFDPDFGYEHWVDYILQVPMYFLYQDGEYLDVAGADFRDLMAGKLPGFEGRKATMKDWEDHMTVAFPEVRLKKFIEMRGADGGRWDDLMALPAFWVGLLYDTDAQGQALELAEYFHHEDVQNATFDAPKHGLKGHMGKMSLSELTQRLLSISRAGLRQRQKRNNNAQDESIYLEGLQRIVESGQSRADSLLLDYKNAFDSGHLCSSTDDKSQIWLLDRLRN